MNLHPYRFATPLLGEVIRPCGAVDNLDFKRIHAVLRMVAFLWLITGPVFAFGQCAPGDPTSPFGGCLGGAMNAAGQWECPPPNNPCQCGTPSCICIPVVRASDPNDITGPEGYDTAHWVSVKDRLGYMIRFENDPVFATAPAQVVRVELPIDQDLDPYSLQLHGFGFGHYFFQLDNSPGFHADRIEETADSLTVFVDIVAGLDVVNRKAYWIFRSIDPTTGLVPIDPLRGFLPVNDTTLADTVPRPGEGFVTFSLKPRSTAETGDTASAQASIVFDINDPIVTNTWENLIDAVAPESELASLPTFTEDMSLPIYWTATDDPGGVGVKDVDLFASRNGGPFYEVAADLESGFYVFEGDTGSSYSFYTMASDHVNNREAVKPGSPYVQFGAITSARIQVKAMLQGAWNGTDMNTSIGPLLPLTDPYGMNETITSIPADAVDWVRVQARSGQDSTMIMGQRACFLRKDGVILDKNGVPGVQFEGLTSSVGYLVVRHRNHFGVMTAQPLNLQQTGQTIDFSAVSTSTFGTNAQVTVSSKRMLRMGNVTGDKFIKYTGSGNDRDPILVAVGSTTPNNIISGYHNTDTNLDGLVKYTGSQNDRDPILVAVGSTVPTSVVVEQLP